MPKISVIVPVYNCERYLEKCLSSLRDQTMPELEFLVVDDGSTDRSGEIAEHFAHEDSRFIVIRKRNGGVASARNAGLDAAQGEYLGFVDADDWVEPSCFEMLYQAALRQDADLVSCDYFVAFTEHEIPSHLNLHTEGDLVTDKTSNRFFFSRSTGEMNLWNHLFRRDLIRLHGLRFETNSGEDVLFQLCLLPYLRRIASVPLPLYHYRQRKSSLMHSKTSNVVSLPSLFECYSRYCSEELDPPLAHLSLSLLFTAFLFSDACIGQPLSYFRQQLSQMHQLPHFNTFCTVLSTTGQMDSLWQQGALTKHFYRTQQFIFAQCNAGRDQCAVWLMWLASRYIFLKRRALPTKNLFE